MNDMNETKKKSKNLPIFLGVAVFLLLIASFFGGVYYEKGNGKTVQTGPVGAFGAQGGTGGQRLRNGTFGTVTAVSDSSITVNETRNNTTATYAVTANTTVTTNGSAGSVSDIKVGDSVLIVASSSDTKTATRIVDGIQGGPGGGFFNGGQQSSGSSQQPNVQTN